MSLPPDFTPYLDIYGLVHSKSWELCGNPIRYTAEAYLCAKEKDDSDALKDVRIGFGLYRKAPFNDRDQLTVDDLLPLAHYFYKYDRKRYYALCLRLLLNAGFYPNTKTWLWKSFQARNLSMLPALARGCVPLTWIGYLFLPVSWIIIARTGIDEPAGQDIYVLSWHLKEMLPFSSISNYFWEMAHQRMLQAYPGGFKELLTQYFGHPHPLALHWPQDPAEVGF